MRVWFGATLMILSILGILALIAMLIFTVGFAFSTGAWWALGLVLVFAGLASALYLGILGIADWMEY